MLISQIEVGRTYLMCNGDHVTVTAVAGCTATVDGCQEPLHDLARHLIADVTPEALPPEELFSEAEAAAQIGVSPSVLRNWRTAGVSKCYLRQGITLPHVQLGRSVRYRRRNVRHFIECVSVPRIKAARSSS